MPIPAILGLPALISFFAGALGGIASFLIKYWTKKTVMIATFVAGVVALFAAFYAAIWALFASLSVSLPPHFSDAVGYVMPDNAIPCVTAIMSAHVIKFAYQYNEYLVSKVSLATIG